MADPTDANYKDSQATEWGDYGGRLKKAGTNVATGLFHDIPLALLDIPGNIIKGIAKDPSGMMTAVAAGLGNPQAIERAAASEERKQQIQALENVRKFAIGSGMMTKEQAEFLPLDFTAENAMQFQKLTHPERKVMQLKSGQPYLDEHGAVQTAPGTAQPKLSEVQGEWLAKQPPDVQSKFMMALPTQREASAGFSDERAKSEGEHRRLVQAQAENVMFKTLRGQALLPEEVDAADVKTADIKDKIARRQILTPLEAEYYKARTGKTIEQTADITLTRPGRIANAEARAQKLLSDMTINEALAPEKAAKLRQETRKIEEQIKRGIEAGPLQLALLNARAQHLQAQDTRGDLKDAQDRRWLDQRIAESTAKMPLYALQGDKIKAQTQTELQRPALVQAQTEGTSARTDFTKARTFTEGAVQELKRGQIKTQQLKDAVLELQPGIIADTQALRQAQTKVQNGQLLLQKDRHAINMALLKKQKAQTAGVDAYEKKLKNPSVVLSEAEQAAFDTVFRAKSKPTAMPSGPDGRLAIANAQKKLGRMPTPEEAWKEYQQIPTSATRTMKEAAVKLIPRVDAARESLLKIWNRLGPVKTRWSEFLTTGVGIADPDFSSFRTKFHLASTLLLRMHVGGRGGDNMLREFKGLIDTSYQSPENLLASLQAIDEYARGVTTEHPDSPEQVPALAQPGAEYPDAIKLY